MPIDNAQQLAVPMPMKNLDLNMHSSAVDGDSREIEKRTCESSIRRAFAAHYLLFVHLVIYITTFCAILFWLSGKAMRFNDNIVMEGVSFLRTSDILTIITAVLVVIRTVTARRLQFLLHDLIPHAGKVNIQADVMRRVDNGRIHPNWTLVSNVKRDVTKFEPDRWVNETMYLLPYLLHLISTANDVYRPQATNLEGYIKNVVQNAYSAIWVVLDATLNLNPDKYDPGKSTFMSDITFMMRARIKKQRLYAWLALNLLFTISGILHLLLERLSSRPIIVDTAAAALTTDVSRLLADPQIAKLKWRNMSYVTKEDVFGSEKELCSDNRIRLKLERLGDGFGLSRKLD
ncbi:Similar to predicted protein [Nectria haematococca mpVI 77-13-4]; acc. no. XP_003042551 [Pyronema omphalodes CBS 100304]|uniref:Uncharacterized protein n=1 Tax=Pyronema omphalodes (strain CBS 100304) TaxID=1076935 RepID=U4LM01_PYROM|nr:Similar to predicted protein [Nectria haematococca mpVI 77-13-4]; acc. no. XP_003042551 [Pyronema omphalodes CBS 100304]